MLSLIERKRSYRLVSIQLHESKARYIKTFEDFVMLTEISENQDDVNLRSLALEARPPLKVMRLIYAFPFGVLRYVYASLEDIYVLHCTTTEQPLHGLPLFAMPSGGLNSASI